ncbi:oxidoreductase [Westerdykella ornata]|uniref:Oxidoreductase n=1 Tax=Westerdykella ornata TaxID=318751 RepID=A0A6A6JBA5_WESOR|nr:oxidoreductase [Westerdykella ornata]KAF2273900.1 oxidoreductase [Westerdykella ornata]
MGRLESGTSLQIPALTGKVILVTGGTSGLGSEIVLQLSQHNPEHILFTGRNHDGANRLIQTINSATQTRVTFIPCDFTSLTSVKKAGDAIASAASRLDLVFCNAGVMAVPKGTTEDGYEIQFGINHLAHALLIEVLLPTLLRTAESPGSDVRIVFTTSLGFTFATTIDFPHLRSEHDMGILGALKRYGQSKLANILYARQLAEHYPSIVSVSVHPGIVKTGMASRFSTFYRYFIKLATIGRQVSVTEGSKNQLWAATTGRESIKNGQFYEPVGKVGRRTSASRDDKLAAELWAWTEEQLKGFM